MLKRFAERLADRFILRDSRDPIDAGVQRRELLETPHGQIEFYVARYPEERHDAPVDRLIFKLPGTNGRAERSTLFPAPLLPSATDCATEIWTWNPPGYGASHGLPRLQAMPPAAIDCWDMLRKRFPDAFRIIVGNSLGAATSLHLASQREIDLMLLRNPPALRQIVGRRGHWWNARRGGRFVAAGVPLEMDAVINASRCSAPCVFLQSECDSLVTPDLQAMVHQEYGGPKHVVTLPGAEHATPLEEDWLPEIEAAISAIRSWDDDC